MLEYSEISFRQPFGSGERIPWFADIEKKNPNQQVQRLKQYIMDNYIFNLDLETWGLTQKETELKRFESFIDNEDLSQSNALFGYEGDKILFFCRYS